MHLELTHIIRQWQTLISPDLLWEEEDTSPDKDSSELTWQDVRQQFGDILRKEGPPDLESKAGYFLGRVECAVTADYACWAPSIEEAIDDILKWRFKWPQLHDPAFTRLDSFLRRFRPQFSVT
jgi:hypothetical protein